MYKNCVNQHTQGLHKEESCIIYKTLSSIKSIIFPRIVSKNHNIHRVLLNFSLEQHVNQFKNTCYLCDSVFTSIQVTLQDNNIDKRHVFVFAWFDLLESINKIYNSKSYYISIVKKTLPNISCIIFRWESLHYLLWLCVFSNLFLFLFNWY